MTDERSRTTTRCIELPAETAQALEARLERSEFESIDAYAAFALDLLLREIDDRQTDVNDVDPPEREDSAPGSGIENRLESLGYL